MSNYDQFALWLNNRLLLDELTDNDLHSQCAQIYELFGGFKEMIKLCIGKVHSSKLQKHQTLFKLLSDIKEESELDNSSVIKLNSMHNDAISHIFTFLPGRDHGRLMKSCRRLAIIGRRKYSCFNKNVSSHLLLIHRLPHFKNLLKSNNVSHKRNVITEINSIYSMSRGWEDFYDSKKKRRTKLILESDILPDIFRIFTETTHSSISLPALQLYLQFTKLFVHVSSSVFNYGVHSKKKSNP
eukprot:177686_1